jgi:hypothetical protein
MDCFCCVVVKWRVPSVMVTPENFVEPRLMDWTSACLESFDDLGIFIDACDAIADGCEHRPADKPYVPRPYHSQLLHRVSTLPHSSVTDGEGDEAGKFWWE